VLSRTITWMNRRSLTNKPHKAAKAQKIAPKSFERRYLGVSPLFRQFATVGRRLTVRKLLILLEGTQVGWGITSE